MPQSTTKVEVVPVDNELGIILPVAVVQDLGLRASDELFFEETPVGFQFTAVTAVMRRVMEENREVLRQLAES